MEKLTAEQIRNWRRALIPIIGLYALMIPAEDIQEYRDSFQRECDRKSKASHLGKPVMNKRMSYPAF